MDDRLLKANRAMLEGDREEVLRLLDGQPSNAETLWLRANAVEAEEDRLALLRQVVSARHAVYSELATGTLERESSFAADLAVPPSWQFWKEPHWKRVREWFSRHSLGCGIAVVVVLLIGGLAVAVIWFGLP